MTASAVIDLPEPLSPITPSTSPAPAAIATSCRIGRPWMASVELLDGEQRHASASRAQRKRPVESAAATVAA